MQAKPEDKRLIVFDLDGTLTESKSYLQDDMRDAIINLLHLGGKHVGIISGCSYEQMFNQFLVPIRDILYCRDYMYSAMMKLHLLPMSGSSLYQWNRFERRFEHRYRNDLALHEKAEIYNAWKSSTINADFSCEPYGEIAEDRGSQITFSMCGQKAPLNVKEKYDPSASIRKKIVMAMQSYLPKGYEIRIGGTTSIDVTKEGMDKAYGVGRLLKITKMYKKHTLFVGDSLFDGGNDAAVKKLNIDCKEVSCINDTLNIINSIVGECY